MTFYPSYPMPPDRTKAISVSGKIWLASDRVVSVMFVSEYSLLVIDELKRAILLRRIVRRDELWTNPDGTHWVAHEEPGAASALSIWYAQGHLMFDEHVEVILHPEIGVDYLVDYVASARRDGRGGRGIGIPDDLP